MKKSIILLLSAIYILSAASCSKYSALYPSVVPFPDRTVIYVPASGSIQAAIDQVAAAGGGTVNLASGTYTVASSIRLKSNVTLNGAGTANTTITADSPITIITTDTVGLANLTVQNLKVVGIPNDSFSIGIWIASLTTYFTNVTHNNVEVTNCGGIGVHIKRADSAFVINCNLHNNGSTVYYHNIYVRQSSYVTLNGNRLTDSPEGTGLHVAGVCDHFTLINNVVTNNGIAGMNIQDSPDTILIENNIVSGNGVNHISGHGDGISFTGTNATIDNNITNSNFEGGIHTWNGSGSIIRNQSAANGINYNIHGSFIQKDNL